MRVIEMPLRKDLLGNRYGRLIVVEYSHTIGTTYWKCICDCGGTCVVQGRNLTQGGTTSCGCLHIENAKQKAEARVLDITGQRFGMLLVLYRDCGPRPKGSRVKWICRCDCGSMFSGIAINLARLKDCGCIRRDALSKSKANLNGLFAAYKRGAANRGLEFLLTKEQFKSLIEQNCYYCSVPPSRPYTKGNSIPLFYNGIDRAENTIGYVLDNCRPACTFCNISKGRHPKKEWDEWLVRIGRKWASEQKVEN